MVSAASHYVLQEGNEPRVADYGLPVTTAARLSPPSRTSARRLDRIGPLTVAARNKRGFHVVDGGYYDVYGLVALLNGSTTHCRT